MITPLDRYRGTLLGLAVGDAVGTTVEFKARGTFPRLTDMVGGGTFGLQPGQWTDDTSMALCLARSLLHCDGFDALDQMKRYVRWYRDGYLSSTGDCFDIGTTTRSALGKFESTGDPWAGPCGPSTAGNGSLMRLAPIPLFYAPDAAAAVAHAADSSRTTHGAPQAVDACRLFASLLVSALAGTGKEELLFGERAGLVSPLEPAVAAIASGAWRDKQESEIRSSGYALHSLEAVLWCFHKTSSFRDAVLTAANLGEDADTTAAIVGQLAGAFYGESGIPEEWRQRVLWGPRIAALGEALGRAGNHAAPPFERAYWAVPGTLLAGPYPMGKGEPDPAQKIRSLLDAGVRTFVNLMEEDEVDHAGEPFTPYAPLVQQEAALRGLAVACHRFPVVDVDVPSPALMARIQETLDESLASGQPVYVHCWGGRGRTGTVIGVYYLRRGFADPGDFVEAIAARRGKAATGQSPETAAQRKFVRDYEAGAVGGAGGRGGRKRGR